MIAVGAHDGAGNPVGWSQNNPSAITVLADGTDTLTHTVTTTGMYFLAGQGCIIPTGNSTATAPVSYTLAVSTGRNAAPLAGPGDGSGMLAVAV